MLALNKVNPKHMQKCKECNYASKAWVKIHLLKIVTTSHPIIKWFKHDVARSYYIQQNAVTSILIVGGLIKI